MKLNLTPQQAWRFWSNVNQKEGCWPWLGTIRKREGKNKDIMYGGFQIDGVNYLAHRISFFIHYFVTDLCVLHACDFGMCVRPDHLFAGTRKDNNIDCNKKDRHSMTRHLTELQVLQVRDLRGKLTRLKIAELLNVKIGVIDGILDGRSYKILGREKNG